MELRENIASNYARKTELLDSERRTGEMFNRVLLSIDRLSDKLDRALERNWQPGSRQEND